MVEVELVIENLRKASKKWYSESQPCNRTCRCRKRRIRNFYQDKNFDKWQLIPSFIKGYSDRLEHYVKLFDQENRAW